jgi:hypothetical protein
MLEDLTPNAGLGQVHYRKRLRKGVLHRIGDTLDQHRQAQIFRLRYAHLIVVDNGTDNLIQKPPRNIQSGDDAIGDEGLEGIVLGILMFQLCVDIELGMPSSGEEVRKMGMYHEPLAKLDNIVDVLVHC